MAPHHEGTKSTKVTKSLLYRKNFVSFVIFVSS